MSMSTLLQKWKQRLSNYESSIPLSHPSIASEIAQTGKCVALKMCIQELEKEMDK